MSMEGYPQPIRQFAEDLGILCPDAEITLERGGKTSGAWWMDVTAANTHVVVQWNPAIGFRLEEVAEKDALYGEQLAEHYQTVAQALERLTQLLGESSFVAA